MRPLAVKSSEQTICVSCIYDRELYISDHMACLLAWRTGEDAHW